MSLRRLVGDREQPDDRRERDDQDDDRSRRAAASRHRGARDQACRFLAGVQHGDERRGDDEDADDDHSADRGGGADVEELEPLLDAIDHQRVGRVRRAAAGGDEDDVEHAEGVHHAQDQREKGRRQQQRQDDRGGSAAPRVAPSTAAASRMSVGSDFRPASRISAISGVHSQASIATRVGERAAEDRRAGRADRRGRTRPR